MRLNTEVTSIDPENKELAVFCLKSRKKTTESYDALILATGARPVRPPIPGINSDNIFTVKTIPDIRRIKPKVDKSSSALIIGGGFIGLEMADNLKRRGLSVTLVEMANQVMTALDKDMAAFVERILQEHEIQLMLGSKVTRFKDTDRGVKVFFENTKELEFDMVILAIGVQPEVKLAKEAGIELGEKGGVKVDRSLKSSNPFIWAAGDAIEVFNTLNQKNTLLPLAGPANRQGRIAAFNVINFFSKTTGKDRHFKGVIGTAICEIFGYTAACTGLNEKALISSGNTDFRSIHLHPGNHVSYYPGAQTIHFKVIFNKQNRKVLGAQAFGKEGIARRIDIISTIISLGGSTDDLENSELCYAPQFGAAKDPVNLAGMIANNLLDGLSSVNYASELNQDKFCLLDVSSEEEFMIKSLPKAINIPLEQLRQRFEELDENKNIFIMCRKGQRSYYAQRFLFQKGFQCSYISGGLESFLTLNL